MPTIPFDLPTGNEDVVVSTPHPRETIDWVSSVGVVTRLVIQPGPQGRFMPPIGIVTSQAVGSSGSRVDLIRHNARDIDIPVWIEGATAIECRETLRAWARSIDPVRGTGMLRYTYLDGGVREQACVYVGGFEGDETIEMAGMTYMRAVWSFYAADPYLYEEEPSQQVFRTTAGVPFFPFGGPWAALSESAVIGRQTIDNTGDVESWPRWTIKGPAESVTMTNETTGRTLVFEAAVGAGETIVIDTRPGVKSVTDGTGANRFADFTGSLWAFTSGQNTVTLEAAGGTAATEITMFFRRGYLTA